MFTILMLDLSFIPQENASNSKCFSTNSTRHRWSKQPTIWLPVRAIKMNKKLHTYCPNFLEFFDRSTLARMVGSLRRRKERVGARINQKRGIGNEERCAQRSRWDTHDAWNKMLTSIDFKHACRATFCQAGDIPTNIVTLQAVFFV